MKGSNKLNKPSPKPSPKPSKATTTVPAEKKKTESPSWDTITQQENSNVDPEEFPAPGAPTTTGGPGSSGDENKENHDDEVQRTPNGRKKGA